MKIISTFCKNGRGTLICRWYHYVLASILFFQFNLFVLNAEPPGRFDNGNINVKTNIQDITIKGKITDSEGNPLPGVNVIEKGTINGTVSNLDGDYSITVRSNKVILVFSFIGYLKEEVPINNKTDIDIILIEDIMELDEVVVIGYGTAKKSDLTGSVTTVSTEDFNKIPATSPLQVLQGRASGIQITTNSGLPGDGSSVLIRGVRSINGSSEPIYVIDGVITDRMNHINPNSIESVSVLKDASAAAIYGARAANGVILVTTKRGSDKNHTEISLNSYYGIQTESNLKLDLLNSDQFLELWTESYENAGLDIPWNEETLSYYEGVDTDWKDLMMQNGAIQSYDLSVSGGSENSNYYISAGFLDQKGMIIETNFKKYTLTFNSDHKIKDWIKFGNSLNLFSSKREGSGSPYQLALRKVPLTRAYEDNGDYGVVYNTNLEHFHVNPLWQAKETIDQTLYNGLQGNVYLTLELFKDLDFTIRGSMDYIGAHDSDFSPGIDPKYNWEGTNINTVYKRDNESLHWISDFLLNYNKTINKHDIKVLLGYSVEESTREDIWGQRSGTPNNEIQFLNAGDPTTQQNGNGYTDWAFISTFGRLNYTYNNKYLFTATVRRDGSSRLTEDNRFGIFPSASVAWRVSEEKFLQNINLIDNLKLRASYGTLGNILSISAYGTTAALTSRKAVLNQSGTLGYTLNSAVNSNLKWETANKLNLGFDLALYKNSIYSTLDYFIEDTYDLLFSQTIARSNGLSGSPWINAGQVRNVGYDFELGYRGRKSDWSYDISLNLSHVKNEVIDLEGRDLRTSGLVEGYPVRSFFGYKSNGIIYNESDLAIYTESNQFSNKQVGDIALLDIDSYGEDGTTLTGVPDGVVDAADRTIIGNRYPDLVYGTIGTINYKEWGLQIQLQGVHGVDLNYGPNNSNDLIVLMSTWARNEDARLINRYHPTKNPKGNWPRLSKDLSGSNDIFSEFWLADASYLRLRNINLNYNLPMKYCEFLGMNELGLYISVQNAYTFTKYDGPEVDITSVNVGNLSSSTSTVDPITGIPQPRTWTFGFKATF